MLRIENMDADPNLQLHVHRITKIKVSILFHKKMKPRDTTCQPSLPHVCRG